MSEVQAKLLYDLLEMEAPDKFFIDGKDVPAFLLFPKHHFASRHGYTLYLNRVGVIASFSSNKKALERLKEIVERANFPMRLYRVRKYGGKRNKRILFAENKKQRVDMTDAKGPCRMFNIDEWEPVRLTVNKEASG